MDAFTLHRLSGLRAIFAVAALCAAFLAAPAFANAQGSETDDETIGFQLDPFARVEAGIISAEASTQNDEFIVNGDGITLRAAAGFHLGNERSRITLEADHLRVLRLGEGRSDTDRERFTASFQQQVSEAVSIELRARRYDDLSTAEFSDTDEFELSAELQYEPQRAHRVQIRAGWHSREYDDGDGPDGASSTGEGARVSAQYRRRLERYHYLTFDLRAEEFNSDNAPRAYSRQSAGASYTRPLTRDLRLRPAVYVQHTRFDGRFTDARFTDARNRDDTLIVPELEVHYWPGQLRLEAEAKYIFAKSNDPFREREGYRLSFTIGYVF